MTRVQPAPITVPDATRRHDLLRHDPGASPPALQRPYLELDPEGRTVALDARCQCETGEPEYVWHGRSHRYALPVCVDPQALVEWLRGPEAQALLRRICEGHTVEWDGHNHVGTLTQDAADASDTLADALLDAETLSEQAGLWEASEWFRADDAADLGITAETDDAALAALAERYAAEALAECDALVVGADTHLRALRDTLRAAD